MAEEHKPYIAAHESIYELTLVPVLMGIVLGIIFGASSLYLALKVGMTVSASIPVAVLSITLFRTFSKTFGFRQTTILENNIVQTTGSAGESIAFGVAITMPALFILGFDMELSRTMLVAVLGSALGILMMIPLRHALVSTSHHELPFPEGTACAEVLIVGEKGGMSAKTVFAGFFVGLFYKFLNVGFKLWNDVPEKALDWFKGAAISAEVSPELLGVGYILGPKISSVMGAGGVIQAWVLIPLIKLFGEGLTSPLFPATKLISQMNIHEIWKSYVLYIGTGAIVTGGIISMIQVTPTIVRTALANLGTLKNSKEFSKSSKRTERDLSFKIVLGGCIALILAIWFAPTLKMNVLGAIIIVFFGFLFVSVSSRLTGTVGSSSNPVSGMTVATLLATCLIFLVLGWTSAEYRVVALSVAAIVCVAASNGGTTAQDLKTGYLVGSTPKAQQIAILVGSVSSAIVIGYVLQLLNQASTIYSKKIPQAQISNVTELKQMEYIQGPERNQDPNAYHVLHLVETPATGELSKLQPGKYLVDDAGMVKYLVDPGINGILRARDNGTTVQKYEAPKARLFSMIIDGILSRKLPWGLVLLGVSIALVLELCGVASLPFAVGVYLPLSTSFAIFCGGVVRWLVDTFRTKKEKSEDIESSPGVLFSSGLIAGGAICGIAIAILSVKEGWGEALDFSKPLSWMASNDWTSVVAFALLSLLVFKVGLGKKTRA